MIKKNIMDLIGNTPLMELGRMMGDKEATVVAKLELFNPAGSAKDRIAKALIEDAEEKGILNEDSVIIEPTSGNTGVGLAAVAAAKNYRVILTMPETMSIERRNLLKAFGAEIVLTPSAEGMVGAIRKAEALRDSMPGAFIPGQFENEKNPQAHYDTTGPEIWKETEGKVDIFVAGVGTGGTISGVGKYLKEKNPDIKVVGVEPAGSPILTEGKSGPHKIQGIGAGFVPEVLNRDVIDEIIAVTDNDAYDKGNEFAKTEGMLAGISSGAALHVAGVLADRPENKGKMIVVLLPDTGERYLSTGLFDS